MLVAGMLSGRALGGSWARFWFDFEGFGTGLGRVWEGSGRVLGGFGAQNLHFCWTAFLDFAF